MTVELTAPRSELGLAVADELRAGPDRGPAGRVLVNLASQAPNSLLHDGHAWHKIGPTEIVESARRALRRRPEPDLVVHASYAFLLAVERGAKVGDRLQPIVEAALEAEQIVLEAGRPARVVRLGYLYGPRSRDLKAYRTAFRLGRPYWAGPSRCRHLFLHTSDAARAVLAVAGKPPRRSIVYAADRRPASFGDFMDHFARLVGNPIPIHLPRISRAVSRLVVAEEHMQMVEMGFTGAVPARPAGFGPLFGDYRSGLEAVVESWG